jgi:Galactose oxidase, central domain
MKNKQNNSMRTSAIQMTLWITLVSLSAALLTFAAEGQLQQSPTGDPSWTPTGGLGTARAYHTATLLPDGQVLVAGGIGSTGTSTTSAELYDPATGIWTATGSLVTAHHSHSATLLPNGKVLVAGGVGSNASRAELYDPATGMWTATDNLNTARANHTATLLPNGKVLVAGGEPIMAALVWPARNFMIRRLERGRRRTI